MRRAFIGLYGLFILLLLVPTALVLTESALRQFDREYRGTVAVAESKFVDPQYGNIIKAYSPFAEYFLNPVYLLSPRTDEQFRRANNNDVVTISSDGFRGLGPSARGDRKLAVLLGASTAFGHGSSSDDTTIPGYLNSLQS